MSPACKNLCVNACSLRNTQEERELLMRSQTHESTSTAKGTLNVYLS